MDRAIHSASAEKRGICSIYDCIHAPFRDVALHDLDWRAVHSPVDGSTFTTLSHHGKCAGHPKVGEAEIISLVATSR